MLNLHSGGELVPYEEIRELDTPPATATHVPIEHHRLIELTRATLGMFGHSIVAEHFALDHGSDRFFGLMELHSPYTGYRDTLGLRNSHDKSFPIGIAFGSSVFVCSNLAFMSDHVIRRKHTANAKRELPGLLMEIIEPLALQRERQAKTIEHYRHALLTDQQADHLTMQLYRGGAINVQRIAAVDREWHEPSFDEFRDGPRSAWRYFNAVTYALDGRVAENPQATRLLHCTIDGIVEHLN